MQPSSATEQKVNGILKYVRQYLDLRFGHASRLNSKFRQVESDLKWHEVDSLRHILTRSKPSGEFRIPVVDMMMSFDPEKRRGVFAPKGQISIMNEIVTAGQEGDQKSSGLLSIRDLASLYNAIDPFFKSIFELMQAWVWWDIPDATDLAIFDAQVDRIRLLMRSQLNENLANYYRNEMKSDRGSDMQSIIEFEYARTESIVDQLQKRRSAEENYQQIIAREAGGSNGADTLVIQLAQHLRALEKLKSSEEVDPSLREYYARALKCDPEEVDGASALEYQQNYVTNARQELLDALQQGDEEGLPYNFKLRQLGEVRSRFERLHAEIHPQETYKTEAAVAG